AGPRSWLSYCKLSTRHVVRHRRHLQGVEEEARHQSLHRVCRAAARGGRGLRGARHADHAESDHVPVGARRGRRVRDDRAVTELGVARRRGGRVRILVRARLSRWPARAPAQDRLTARPPARLPDGRAQGDADVRLRRGALSAVHLDLRRGEPHRHLLLGVRRRERAVSRQEPRVDVVSLGEICMIERAILIAAGRGRRLGPHTEDIPKCMVDVAGRPILGWVWRALASVGVRELVVIRGYRGEVLESFVRDLVPGALFVDNRDWQTNNVLLSLACARAYLDRPCYLTYSDIVFTPEV